MSETLGRPIRSTTIGGIAGAHVIRTLGIVMGIAIRTRGVGGNIMAGLDALGNGSALAELRDDLVTVRREALARMEAEAAERGANAVLEVRFDAAEVGREMVEIVAYGTAVVLQEQEPMSPRIG
jgi:uncharacterized protein YbjQ (UPF0145 family)